MFRILIRALQETDLHEMIRKAIEILSTVLQHQLVITEGNEEEWCGEVCISDGCTNYLLICGNEREIDIIAG